MDRNEKALIIRRKSHRSFRNIRDAARLLQNKQHDEFPTKAVKDTSMHTARKISQETGMTLAEVEKWASSNMRGGSNP